MEAQGAALPFASGFILASLALHGAGAGLALLLGLLAARWPARLLGGGVMLSGLALAFAA